MATPRKIDDIDLEEERQVLSKILGKGIVEPATAGLITTVFDPGEYKKSKLDDGFIHKMPICIHVRAAGSGSYDEYINKYLTLEEAKDFYEILGKNIAHVELINKHIDEIKPEHRSYSFDVVQ